LAKGLLLRPLPEGEAFAVGTDVVVATGLARELGLEKVGGATTGVGGTTCTGCTTGFFDERDFTDTVFIDGGLLKEYAIDF
jgi:hypothetical protein